MSVMIALVAGSATACHYKAGTQYTDDTDVPGADSGTRRVSTTTMRSDSTNMPSDAATASSAAATLPSAMSAPATKPAGAATASTIKPMTRAKFARGRASVTMPKIYGAAEVAPQFPGGEHGLDNYINKNVNYPQQAIDDDVSGTVHVSFVVDENGHVTKAKVMDAANLSDGLDQEALRVVKDMPAWMPGTVKGKKVKTRMELPISFQVES
jgi:TonB family protein